MLWELLRWSASAGRHIPRIPLLINNFLQSLPQEIIGRSTRKLPVGKSRDTPDLRPVKTLRQPLIAGQEVYKKSPGTGQKMRGDISIHQYLAQLTSNVLLRPCWKRWLILLYLQCLQREYRLRLSAGALLLVQLYSVTCIPVLIATLTA